MGPQRTFSGAGAAGAPAPAPRARFPAPAGRLLGGLLPGHLPLQRPEGGGALQGLLPLPPPGLLAGLKVRGLQGLPGPPGRGVKFGRGAGAGRRHRRTGVPALGRQPFPPGQLRGLGFAPLRFPLGLGLVQGQLQGRGDFMGMKIPGHLLGTAGEDPGGAFGPRQRLAGGGLQVADAEPVIQPQHPLMPERVLTIQVVGQLAGVGRRLGAQGHFLELAVQERDPVIRELEVPLQERLERPVFPQDLAVEFLGLVPELPGPGEILRGAALLPDQGLELLHPFDLPVPQAHQPLLAGHLQVVAHVLVDNLLHAAYLLRLHRLQMREIEAQAVRAHHRAALLHVLAQNLAQGVVQ